EERAGIRGLDQRRRVERAILEDRAVRAADFAIRGAALCAEPAVARELRQLRVVARGLDAGVEVEVPGRERSVRSGVAVAGVAAHGEERLAARLRARVEHPDDAQVELVEPAER